MEETILLPAGFWLTGLHCGIKSSANHDLGLIHSEPPATAFGFFTKNDVKAAPVIYCEKSLSQNNQVSQVLVNSGNANACTGKLGMDNLLETVSMLKEKFQSKAEVLMCSTGVIGEQLPMGKLKAGIEKLSLPDGPNNPNGFAASIMTTDTVPKISSREIFIEGQKISFTAFCKGAGMIQPNMATMLAYVICDLKFASNMKEALREVVDKSFNSITVDGDMSTNDTVLFLGNGASGLDFDKLSEEDKKLVLDTLADICIEQAKKIVADGEGATKVVQIDINGAPNAEVGKKLARQVANSPLVKTAIFGRDPNWGRILASLGSVSAGLHPDSINISLCAVPVFTNGGPADFDEADLVHKMGEKDILLSVELGLGDASWTYWTCDLTYDYIKINADYHT